MAKTHAAYGLVLLIAGGCTSSSTTIHTTLTQYVHVDPVIDLRDGRSYPAVAIGGQVWMARNVAFPTEPSWCYEDEPGDCEANGRLYSWTKAREACPGGWHLPTDAEWMDLERILGMPEDELQSEEWRGVDEAPALLEGGDSGFDARTPGYRGPDGGYAHRGERAAYWSATEADRLTAWHRALRVDEGGIERGAVSKELGLSVRCIRDEPVAGFRTDGRESSR